MVLLTWLYISAYVVLLGACFNAEMERQTARTPPPGRKGPWVSGVQKWRTPLRTARVQITTE